MKISNIVTFLMVSIICILYYFNLGVENSSVANKVFEVYLSGDQIGTIKDENELYNLINQEQKEIKEKYSVDNVYPPDDLEIIEVSSYNEVISTSKEMYSLIENNDNFTIEGYEIIITDNSNKEDIKETKIHVLDKQIFTDAMDKFLDAYIDKSMYDNFINDEQEEIVYTGLTIDDMYFKENISIKKTYVSVDNTIFTDSNSLVQYLIFGENANIVDYKIQEGDTIASIADDNKLSISEFLISNPDYRNPDTMLQINDTVNVTLQKPILNFVYKVTETDELEIDFVNSTIYSGNYTSGYSEITTEGVKGLELVTMSYEVTNGIQSQEITRLNSVEIRKAVNQVTTRGAGYYNTAINKGYIETGLDLTLPVESGFIVTSPFGVWRESYYHDGTDFSGTGYYSDIYSIADGVVTQTGEACDTCARWQYGTFIIIGHGNNYFSTYLHLARNSIKVKVGQKVTKGQLIGHMGSTGNSTGNHLHLGFSVGEPRTGTKVTYYDAYKLIYGQ